MLNLVNGSIQSELSRFFQILEDAPIALRSVSAAAFCKARKKFSYSAFVELNQSLITTFYSGSTAELWKGHRLLAIDGSVTRLPNTPELLKHFGKARIHANRPAVRLSQLYDIKNKLTIDIKVGKHTSGERDLALQHLAYAKENDLILYDRGYPATWMFIYHKIKSIHFCARVPVDFSNIIGNFVTSGKTDRQVKLECIEKSLRKCRQLGLPTTPITVRLIKVKSKCGRTVVLATSLLDREKYPRRLFQGLYHERWFVEEDYKLMKSRLEIENFSGLSVEAIHQDIHAKVLAKNLASLAIMDANEIVSERNQNRYYDYKVNATYVLGQLKDNLVRFILRLVRSKRINEFIENIANAVNAIRPGRSFDRGKRTVVRNKYPTAYKRVR